VKTSDPDDRDRDLERLAADLAADPGYALGARRFPRKVSEDQAVGLAQAMAQEFDHGAARRAELAHEAGLEIYCRPGCATCCEIAVMVYEPEARAIVRFLQSEEGAAALTWFRDAYPEWRAQIGDAPERLTEHFIRRDGPAYDQLHLSLWRRRIRCAFNQDGACTIYPVRPLGCRNAHALSTDAFCGADAPRPAEAVSFVPLDEFLKGATRVLRAAHNAMGARRHAQEAVCAAVHRLLGT
jgi:Fe-S-cluster containining protein